MYKITFCVTEIMSSQYLCVCVCASNHCKFPALFLVKQQKKCVGVLDRECSVSLRVLQKDKIEISNKSLSQGFFLKLDLISLPKYGYLLLNGIHRVNLESSSPG